MKNVKKKKRWKSEYPHDFDTSNIYLLIDLKLINKRAERIEKSKNSNFVLVHKLHMFYILSFETLCVHGENWIAKMII